MTAVAGDSAIIRAGKQIASASTPGDRLRRGTESLVELQDNDET